MVSISDILKVLDKVPAWKVLKELPDKVAALEKRIEELEKQPIKPSYQQSCEVCGAPVKVLEIRDHPELGDAGIKERVLKCENGHQLSVIWDPANILGKNPS